MVSTHRLYYTEPYRTSFDAAVVSCEALADRIELVLDQTTFYPTSGGQPSDRGTIDDAQVLDVVEREDGVVVHVVDRPLLPGGSVHGVVDWARRFDHMQQHTGQHLLSAAFDRLFEVRTESFHLGAASATIDLHRGVTAADIQAAEAEANRIVWEDRPVTVRFVAAEEAARLTLRKDPARTGTLRLIDIDDFDLSACGGTHVARAGAIGSIAVSGWEKFRSGTRVEFLCGSRALGRFREWRTALSAVTARLSVTPSDLALSVERLQAEAKSQQRTMRALQDELATCRARALVERGVAAGDRIVIAEAVDGLDAAGLKALAAAVAAAEPSAAVALFSAVSPALAVMARGASVSLDAAAVLKALVARFGGKGGGKPDLAQGGGLVADSGALVDAARALLHGSDSATREPGDR